MGTSYSDDIVLDTTPPSLNNPTAGYAKGGGPIVGSSTAPNSVEAAGSLKTVKVSAKATDKVSGVKQIEISTTRGSENSATLAFKQSVTIRTTANPGDLWVRVQDGAGNWSSWKQAKGS